MSRPRLSTGNIFFNMSSKDSATPPAKTPKDDDKPMHIAIVGNFSGNVSGNNLEQGHVEQGKSRDQATLKKSKAIEVDRDNFEEVFSDFGVSLALPFCQQPIQFEEFDDLHPDYIYERVPLFDQFRVLQRKLRKPQLFDEAAAEIQQWSQRTSSELTSPKDIEGTQQQDDEHIPEGIPLPDNMLDAIFNQTETATNTTNYASADSIDRMIKDIVAPYVQQKSDPRLPEMEEALMQANGETLRKIMHASDFQEIEANWRSVDMLVRRVNTNRRLKFFIIDINQEEMREDLCSSTDLTETSLYQCLVEKYQVPGSIPFSVLQFCTHIEDNEDDIKLASGFANLAASSGAIALAGADAKLAGCDGFSNKEDSDGWQYPLDEEFTQHWQTLREHDSSRYLALAAPRFLLRLPYGKRTDPVESFAFEELPENNRHDYYLWGNSATLVSLAIAENYSEDGWDLDLNRAEEIEDLPLHVFQYEGESLVQACAELYLRDSGVDKLAEKGVLSIRSVRGKASVLLPKFRTLSYSGEYIFA